METLQATKNSITLKGSAMIITEYLNYAINSILFQRGIYPPETFQTAQQYGLTIFVSKMDKVQEFIKIIMEKAQEWITDKKLEEIYMVIRNASNQEVLECWQFQIQKDETDSISPDGTSNKDLKRIQQEIGSVMRQISATVTYLPLLDCVCTFDLHIRAEQDLDVPENWDVIDKAVIKNSQTVPLRNFSTGMHNVDTVVHFKMAS